MFVKYLLLSIVAPALVFGCVTAFGAGFQPAPIDPEFLDKPGSPFSHVSCRYTDDIKFDKLPDDAGEWVKTGRLAMNGVVPVDFAAYSSEGSRDPDTLIFDLNGDKDLTNDDKITGFTRDDHKLVTVNLPGGKEFRAKIRLSQSRMAIQAMTWQKGVVEVGGRKLSAALVDMDGTGYSLSGARDWMLIDLNGNGKFDADFSGYDLSELRILQPEVLIGGKLYVVTLDAGKPDVTLKPFTGPQGKLALDLAFAKSGVKYEFVGYAREAKGMNMLSAAQADFPIAMRTGEVTLAMGMLMLTDESDRTAMVQFSMEQPIAIEADKTTKLTVGDHKPFEATVGQIAQKLSVSQRLVSESGVIYGRIYGFAKDFDMLKSQPKGPAVKILDKAGKTLAEGNMEYG